MGIAKWVPDGGLGNSPSPVCGDGIELVGEVASRGVALGLRYRPPPPPPTFPPGGFAAIYWNGIQYIT